jgi:glutamine amidotransferase
VIAVIDYGMGNLSSVMNAFRVLGFASFIASRPEELDKADRVALPGVGAFEGAAAELRRAGWDEKILEVVRSGRHLLGICLGMHLMFEVGRENGTHKGLGIFPGSVERIPDGFSPDGRKLKIPQVGWNSLERRSRSPILSDEDGVYVYFVHSYHAVTDPEIITSVTSYGSDITASVGRGNVHGVQFHPEKSGRSGLDILRRFASL